MGFLMPPLPPQRRQHRRCDSAASVTDTCGSLCSGDVLEVRLDDDDDDDCACSTSSSWSSSSALSEADDASPTSSFRAQDPCSAGADDDDDDPVLLRRSHWARTSDGWDLHLLHVALPAAAAQQHHHHHQQRRRRQHPVLLVPGLASSGAATYDLDPSVSLARHLALQGWDVWVADLRGNGRSDRPATPFSPESHWTVDTHLRQDVPAILEYVLAATGHRRVHWVGHSMGGMLACALFSSRSPHARRIASLTTLASGCFGAGSWHGWLQGLVRTVAAWGFPAGAAGRLLGALAGTPLSPATAAFETLFFWRSNMPAALQRKLLATCFAFIPRGVVAQFMGAASGLNSPGGIASVDGAQRYACPEALAEADVPVLGITGDYDLFCPAAGGYRTVQLFGSAHKEFVFLGPGYGNAHDHYGHFDVVAGRRCVQEVYPRITAWLQQHDAARSSSGE